jgi:hypothetical protein
MTHQTGQPLWFSPSPSTGEGRDGGGSLASTATVSPPPQPSPIKGEGARRLLRDLCFLLALTPLASTAADFTTDLQHHWLAPRAADFARASAPLVPALQTLCNAPPSGSEPALSEARQQWLTALAAWERLSAVAIGPVLERRSQRQIDFTPTRPRLIDKAIKAAPKTPTDMELIGTPAKGLPALEWLLWTKPVQPASPACGYAVRVAEEVHREAQALATSPAPAADPKTVLSDLVNQWVGGLERLRWANLEMPTRVAMTGGGQEAPDYPRLASGASAASWAAQWDGLKALATGPVSLASALGAAGQTQVAGDLTRTVAAADNAMQGLSDADGARILAAAKALAELKRLVEDRVAPALGVSIGFSDADGD